MKLECIDDSTTGSSRSQDQQKQTQSTEGKDEEDGNNQKGGEGEEGEEQVVEVKPGIQFCKVFNCRHLHMQPSSAPQISNLIRVSYHSLH